MAKHTNMHRRSLLAASSSLLILTSGCLSESRSSSLETVNDPPEWLSEDNDCEIGYAAGYLSLSGRNEDVGDSVAVVDYNELTDHSKLLVRYSVENGIAKSCSNEVPFMDFLREIDNLALEPYRDENNHGPDTTSIHAAGGYYNIVRLAASDVVFS
ncbi:hypothetical protein [Haloarchaeobius sp. FL176]|uniref:hypothetical protein n=1 Tax=Haloarchaeobius sp. FL176 TaxID=2967129 RepID=UPI0021488E27|nr:hypothetical protein [Haloarchaeobius sp. FL176]